MKEDYKLTFNPESGRIKIEHQFKREIECTSEIWAGYGIINIVVRNAKRKINKISEWLDEYKKTIIKSVALAMTQAWVFKKREISYVNLSKAFSTGEFLDYFWNMTAAIMRRMKDGKDCKKLWEEFGDNLDDIRAIYEKREEIGRQYRNYLRLICKGLERTKHGLKVQDMFLMQQNMLIDKKINSNSLTEFIFCGADTDGKIIEYDPQDGTSKDFIEMCMVLRDVLMNYQDQKHVIEPKSYEKLVSVLDLYTAGAQTDIASIAGLDKLDLKSGIDWRANADIVFNYLQRIRRENMIMEYVLSRT